ncbi:MAG: ATP-dependent protease ATPase subunit HslU [Candidatus Cloacimonetes bacterium]|nr:ATP-dependent protease ATPase subunit HslU [Candidatus Cloacimonadota bacterium]
MKDILTPKKIVAELDKYIVGQDKAKRAVAIALRNRWRRKQIKGELSKEIMPNNIILIGPTGVGKTEIARRISRLTNAPFIKVEASKYTEVGYVGRDVESMVRELLSIAINEVRQEMAEEVAIIALEMARLQVVDKLTPRIPEAPNETEEEKKEREARYLRQKDKIRNLLDEGKLDDREIEIIPERNPFSQIEAFSNSGLETIDFQLGDIIGGILPFKGKKEPKKFKVPEAINYFYQTESEKLVNKEKVIEEAKYRVENNGIIFIDEIDKIATPEHKMGNDVSRSGVQRDLLPIVEGSHVPTKHGIVDTSHILFIASGAFSSSKPSDLIPELQGRFPIREELNSLTREDFLKILTLPKNSLTIQYKALLETEKVELSFNDDALEALADYTALANEKMTDIGARRLQTVMNALLEGFLFDIPDAKIKKINITRELVIEKLDRIIKSVDLAKYIL